MNQEAVLQNLGMSHAESRVYLALLRLGGAPANQIAQAAGIQRTTIYALLKNLARQGFVSQYFRGSKRYYHAAKPQHVAGNFAQRLEAFNQLIPQLVYAEKSQAQALGLRFIETLDELKDFYRGILKEYAGKSYRIIGSAGAWEDLDPEFFVQYRQERSAAGIHTQLLLTADSQKRSPTNPDLQRHVRFLPAKYQFKSTLDIYDDKVLIVSPELSSLAVLIQVPMMVDVFKSVFAVIWDSMVSE